MIKTVTLAVDAASAANDDRLKMLLAAECRTPYTQITGYRLLRRSVDARSRQPKIVLQAEVFIKEPVKQPSRFDPDLCDVTHADPAIIVGFGPAGIFAALKLISNGIKPIIIERGKDVRARRRDLAAINKDGVVNPESNYCFGEGGAGTYSDGKLYTRSTKRGDVQRILQLFHHFGADESVLIDAHPHIGTNKLPGIITAMRRQIIACGGEVHFNTRLTDIMIDRGAVTGIRTADGATFKSDQLILATGHSARDVFDLLFRKGIHIEQKPFALGVRIEHPQAIIDSAMYHCMVRDPLLPAASYSMVSQAGGRGVFSFCMCPGGIIAPAATAPNEVVVNGWSPSKRNNPFANSGVVATVDAPDFLKYGFDGPLAALHYQQMVEQRSWQMGGGKLVAPAQRLTDFVEGRLSAQLPDCSYHPGLRSVQLADVLPKEVAAALKAALPDFGKKMKGYYTGEAVMVATESRTSSPVRIPRNSETLQHPDVKGLYPCGEGAGYAGGIVSAAIDGERCADLVVKVKRGK